ncbi:ribosome-binding factor A [Gemmata sp. JC717]|uniref:Ribosome-binding factor A n=1 Tax=Gemmata algarum TaxID=2975278 RepID=A0ABU5EYB4_9BACT|nr:ribosome-binding factor A [Gemmata algarum]MDY3556223.1 ribosome-binding factor A [Gemmata algarum]MDY3559440.1 ribosome-binding factor A [Gemmata algarum]
MSRRRQKADEFRHLADDIGPEDGTDPKDFHAKPWNAPKQASRKGKQLCAQVRQALDGAFAAARDPVIQATSVVGVEPAPHSGRLRVLVAVPPDVIAQHAVEALARASGFLRSEVAAAISRRYAPELVFEVVPG